MATSNKKVIIWVVEAGLLLALLVVAQLLTFVVPKSVPIAGQLVTGSLVNLVLIVGAGSVGFAGTALAAILSPVFAVLMGQMGFPPMIPVVMLGNLIIVLITWAFFRTLATPVKDAGIFREIIGIILGAAAKCAFLWAGTSLIMVPLFFSSVPKAKQNLLMMMFSWPQGLTAIIGGILALLLLPAIRTYRSHRV